VAVLQDLTNWAAARHIGLLGLIRSPITGPAGNVEFLAHWAPGCKTIHDRRDLIQDCVA
jgi:23S rRNA (cytidine1920-2'-O)/16S rRNA (cytidine1409-2'-O)-methyltransferase